MYILTIKLNASGKEKYVYGTTGQALHCISHSKSVYLYITDEYKVLTHAILLLYKWSFTAYSLLCWTVLIVLCVL
mgnify:FL=1